ncbi:MAG: Glycosyl hydrolase family 109 protein 1 precursor [Candidatus Hydrogenedentes bacterium ADurb.Bin101]|nr:MAG: Glycosyl hydrolase family 109 protein 1 precursor [Candidatus Hydrogenedentes bacterium ADurb.Bin101]HOC68556.1 Gfo/Idh/MocA family oxidoreductase [Candidatus Hydrogenedentota bacterium]
MTQVFSRRIFFNGLAAGAGLLAAAAADDKPIQGFDETASNTTKEQLWSPISERKVRVGLVGYGLCKFSAAFGFQDHPNVEVVAVSDLFPDRCAELAKVTRCEKTYPSLEELVKDPDIEAVFVATDAPSHCRHCIDVLQHGKHVASAVPAVYGSMEDADRLFEAVKASGLNYMMFETSAFRDDCYAMRTLFNAGALGKLVYSEGEYYHYLDKPLDSYKEWRKGSPPLWYPTHSTAYYVCVSGGSFTEVSCLGMKGTMDYLEPANNAYGNPFGTEVALLRTGEGGMSRMTMSKDTPGLCGEIGRVRGTKGSMTGMNYEGLADISAINLAKPPLPSTVAAGGHGGSHGYLCEEFITAILQERKPLIDIAWSLNMTVAGIVAHASALKDGELMKVPQYTF